MDEVGHGLVQPDVVGQRRDAEPGGFAIVADVLAGGLVAEDERIGTGAVQEAAGDAGVARVVDPPLPLHQDDVRVRAPLEHQPLRGAGTAHVELTHVGDVE